MELSGAALYGDPFRECGWDWATASAACVSYVQAFPFLVAGTSGTERHPQLSWTVTGYLCHVGDNLRAWAERVAGVLDGAGPAVGGYDPDELAAARRYDMITLPAALWSLRRAAEDWCVVMAGALERGVVLQHAARGVQRADDIAANNAHEACHHLWDIRRAMSSARPS